MHQSDSDTEMGVGQSVYLSAGYACGLGCQMGDELGGNPPIDYHAMLCSERIGVNF